MDKRSIVNMHLSLAGMLYKLSISSKLGCVVLSMFYMLSFLFNPLKYLALTPGYIIPPNFWIWTFITHLLVETNVFLLICSFAVLIIAGNILESNWGTVKLALFYVLVGVLSGLLMGISYLIIYLCTFDTNYLFNVNIYGTAAVLAGIFVAIKQRNSDTMLIGSIGLYTKDIPLLYIGLTGVLSITGIIRKTYFPLTIYGTLIAWIYLRFYESNARGRGDQSEHFAFKFFFPKVVQGPIGNVSNLIYKFLLKVKICRKAKYRYDVGAPGSINLTLSGVNSLDTERRRNKAIKALDEHLKKSAEVSQSSWPSLDDDEESGLMNQTKYSTSESSKDNELSANSSGDGSTSPDIVTIEMKSNAANA